MKRISIRNCFILFCLLATIDTQAQVLITFSHEGVHQYEYDAGDEFNSDTLDHSKWNTAYPWGRTLYCSADINYYSDNNVSVSNGLLVLHAEQKHIVAKAIPYENDDFQLLCSDKNKGKNLRAFEYTSGMLFSAQKFLYGTYDIRFRVDERHGLWPAFWLFGGDHNEEIDIFEIPGKETGRFHVDTHCPSGCENYKGLFGIFHTHWGGMINTNGAWNKDFNNARLEWQPGYLKWYLNDVPVAYWKGNFSDPMSIIINLAVSNDESFSGLPDAASLPADFIIDYIRYWKPVNQSRLKSASARSINNQFMNGALSATTHKRPVYNKRILNKSNASIQVILKDDHKISLVTKVNHSSSKVSVILKNKEQEILRQQFLANSTELSLAGRNAGLYSLQIEFEGKQSLIQIEVH